MSALPPKADIRQRIEHVCFVPQADIRRGQSMRAGRAAGMSPQSAHGLGGGANDAQSFQAFARSGH